MGKKMSNMELIESGIYDCDLNFVAAILKAARDDYIQARHDRRPGRIAEIERFIRSDTYASLCDIDPEIFIEALRRSASE